MGNFQGGGNRGGGFRSGGNRPPFNKHRGGDRDRERPEMHTAICSECGKSCEVPFRPTGEKPVYCRECFAGKREDGPRAPRDGGFGFDRAPQRNQGRDFGDKPSFKPEQRSAPSGAGDEDTKRQLVEVTRKLDRLITVVEKLVEAKNPGASAMPEAKKAPVMEKKAEKMPEKTVAKAGEKKPEVKAPVMEKKAPAKVVAKKKPAAKAKKK